MKYLILIFLLMGCTATIAPVKGIGALGELFDYVRANELTDGGCHSFDILRGPHVGKYCLRHIKEEK